MILYPLVYLLFNQILVHDFDVVVDQVGFTKEGLIRALEMDLYNNGGYAMDFSLLVC